MALIKCPVCQAEISDKAKLCPKCGMAFASSQTQPVNSMLQQDSQDNTHDISHTNTFLKRAKLFGNVAGAAVVFSWLLFQMCDLLKLLSVGALSNNIEIKYMIAATATVLTLLILFVVSFTKRRTALGIGGILVALTFGIRAYCSSLMAEECDVAVAMCIAGISLFAICVLAGSKNDNRLCLIPIALTLICTLLSIFHYTNYILWGSSAGQAASIFSMAAYALASIGVASAGACAFYKGLQDQIKKSTIAGSDRYIEEKGLKAKTFNAIFICFVAIVIVGCVIAYPLQQVQASSFYQRLAEAL